MKQNTQICHVDFSNDLIWKLFFISNSIVELFLQLMPLVVILVIVFPVLFTNWVSCPAFGFCYIFIFYKRITLGALGWGGIWHFPLWNINANVWDWISVYCKLDTNVLVLIWTWILCISFWVSLYFTVCLGRRNHSSLTTVYSDWIW